MKLYLAAFLLVSQSAFALTELKGPIYLMDDLIPNNSSKVMLAGKNLKSGNDCLFKIEKQDDYKLAYHTELISSDSNNYTERVSTSIRFESDIEINKANRVEASTSDGYPKFLSERDEVVVSQKGKTLTVKMKHVKGLKGSERPQEVSCKFDLKNNSSSADSSCEDNKVQKTISVCKLHKNIGKSEIDLLEAKVKFQIVKSRTCYPGKVVETIDGFAVDSVRYSYENYTSNEFDTLLNVAGMSERSVGKVVSGKDTSTSGNSVERSYSYDRNTKKLVLKYTYTPDFSLTRKTYYNAEFNCH